MKVDRLHVLDQCVGVYDTLMEAGHELGLRDAGYYALEALRLEKGYRAWGRELTLDVTPWEAGLGFTVAMDEPGGFIGREALADAKAAGVPRRRIVQLTLDDPAPVLWSGEAVLLDGRLVGAVRSAAWSHTLGRSVALAMVEDAGGVGAALLRWGGFAVDLAGERHAATLHLRPAHDPQGERLRPRERRVVA